MHHCTLCDSHANLHLRNLPLIALTLDLGHRLEPNGQSFGVVGILVMPLLKFQIQLFFTSYHNSLLSSPTLWLFLPSFYWPLKPADKKQRRCYHDSIALRKWYQQEGQLEGVIGGMWVEGKEKEDNKVSCWVCSLRKATISLMLKSTEGENTDGTKLYWDMFDMCSVCLMMGLIGGIVKHQKTLITCSVSSNG